MDFLKRLLGSTPEPPALTAFEIHFPLDQTRLAVRAPLHTDPQAIIQALQLPHPMPTIFISGGAEKTDLESISVVRSSIEDGLARFLEEHAINLIDGGTSSGMMTLVGVARQRRGYHFPLIGIAPDKMVNYPEAPHPRTPTDLDTFHSHFVLTAGDQFGAESEIIISLAYALSGAGEKKRLVIIANGGEIVKREAHRVSTQNPRFPLLVLEGSGRFADELAASRKNGSSDPLIQDILKHGDVHYISIKAGADNLHHWLENFFGYSY